MKCKEPVLVVMAAGMGSRFGGLKQMEPMGKSGELIIDFSLYDAWRAGFKKVVFVIKKEMEERFKEMMDGGAAGKLETVYVYQELADIPGGRSVPEGREKPWGTGHAVLAARQAVKSPFAVINADDFYGADAFKKMFEFLSEARDDTHYDYCMVGFPIENTLTENGHVARGVCLTDEKGNLKEITERTRIQRNEGVIQYTEDGDSWTEIPEGTLVSMNLWGFTESMLFELKGKFSRFLDEEAASDPMKKEFYLPFAVDELIREGKAQVKVLESADRWYGVTYKEDKDKVKQALTSMQEQGLYPEKIWG